MNLCPCGSLQAFGECCGSYLEGKKKPPTAEALMRSRYCAFLMKDAEYLISTTHPSTRTRQDRLDLKHSFNSCVWLGLSILAAHQGQRHDTAGYVEFIALYQNTGRTDGSKDIQTLQERSFFLQESGSWFYVSGLIKPDVLPHPKKPCWCGSGLKFKACQENHKP